MRTLPLLIIACSSMASAQTPQELLQLAQDAYKSSGGYEIIGKAEVQPAGSSWLLAFPVLIATAPVALDDSRAAVMPSVQAGGPLEYTKDGNGNDPKPLSISFPFAVTGGWSQIAENVASATEIEPEQLPLNGASVQCRVLEVKYKPQRDDDVPPSPVRYSICGDKHLVLKKVVSYSTGRNTDDPAAVWIVTFDIARFGRPAPAWLADSRDRSRLFERDEWLGRPAPAFRLTDLDGKSVDLSSLRGKVVLLDFWSITCGPCLRELPDLEKLAGRYTSDVAIWGISSDQPVHDKKWLARHQQIFPTLTDEEYKVFALYKVQGLPTMVLIDRDGIIQHYWIGAIPISDVASALRETSGSD